ncbi:GntR family transcriptional regulator [Leifsonia xyli subsp. cynodontis DSM 46306]|uniref:HTH gntR-type domain-containing protein n=1 Tax=Leifsonia xyli subsp. cynodontis DSM 46306 TaxID=1389489 RepID=U3P454_LEIXC|nr:GntR family transcriptional regulator [Leifsonia xyli]AGW40526.1 GntR family transcriptional regulator [Leifsonia xyli subsp. cynodontis DSM 46306]
MPLPESASAGGVGRPLSRTSAYEAIKNAILSGVLLPGERLDAKELERWLGVSKTPIRQAVQALVGEGLIVIAPQSHTTVVAPVSEQRIVYSQALGGLLLGLASVAADRISVEDRSALADRIDPLLAAIADRDVDRTIATAGSFFHQWLDHSASPPYIDMMQSTATTFRYHLSVLGRAEGFAWETIGPGYARLQRALIDGDQPGVEQELKALFDLS